MALISIIVPVYNIAEYLPRCLDSLSAQTHRKLEIIAVNDGSSDNSGEILDQYAQKESRLRVVHKSNGGVTSARIAGIKAAQGDYIGFCDGDDMVDPDMYQRLLHNLKKHDADISHCGHKVIYPDGRVVFYYNSGKSSKQDNMAALKSLLLGSTEPGLWNKLYKHSLLHDFLQQETILFDIRINEDLLMNYYLFRMARSCVYEDFCPYHYMKRENSASMSKLNEHQVKDPIRVKQIILADCLGAPMEDTARAALLSTCLHTCNKILRTQDTTFLAELSKLRALIKKENKEKANLPLKAKFLLRLFLHFPKTYHWLYKIAR